MLPTTKLQLKSALQWVIAKVPLPPLLATHHQQLKAPLQVVLNPQLKALLNAHLLNHLLNAHLLNPHLKAPQAKTLRSNRLVLLPTTKETRSSELQDPAALVTLVLVTLALALVLVTLVLALALALALVNQALVNQALNQALLNQALNQAPLNQPHVVLPQLKVAQLNPQLKVAQPNPLLNVPLKVLQLNKVPVKEHPLEDLQVDV